MALLQSSLLCEPFPHFYNVLGFTFCTACSSDPQAFPLGEVRDSYQNTEYIFFNSWLTTTFITLSKWLPSEDAVLGFPEVILKYTTDVL